jgi:hypothetical protein
MATTMAPPIIPKATNMKSAMARIMLPRMSVEQALSTRKNSS